MYPLVANCIPIGYGVAMKETVAKVIQRARYAKGLSLRQLSEVSGVSVGAIHRLESGNGSPQGHTIFRLAEPLGLDPDELLDAMEATA